jgi:hypothetical protein
MTRFTAVAAVALVVLLVPVAAVAKEATIQGPAMVGGKGFFGGELQMANADGQRPVKLTGRIGHIGILDLGGDLKVRCVGKGRMQKTETEQGDVYLCKGSGQALVKGSHFKFRGFAGQYRVHFPAGTRGTFNGTFVHCAKGENGWRCARPAKAERPERPTVTERQRPEPARERPAAPKQDEEIPTVEELADELSDR